MLVEIKGMFGNSLWTRESLYQGWILLSHPPTKDFIVLRLVERCVGAMDSTRFNRGGVFQGTKEPCCISHGQGKTFWSKSNPSTCRSQIWFSLVDGKENHFFTQKGVA